MKILWSPTGFFELRSLVQDSGKFSPLETLSTNRISLSPFPSEESEQLSVVTEDALVEIQPSFSKNQENETQDEYIEIEETAQPFKRRKFNGD